MREIVLDTETTGLDPESGHRVVEIGCVELLNLVPTGRTFQRYINPLRDMPEDAYRVHGLSGEFLAQFAPFGAVVDELLMFLGDAPLVAHNAGFDLKHINAELARLGRVPIATARAVDTVTMARAKFPGAPASLDALCKRFDISNAHRTKHGALLDAELLAEVYLHLRGGRQALLGLEAEIRVQASAAEIIAREVRPARPHDASAAELAAHAEFLKKLKEPVWLL